MRQLENIFRPLAKKFLDDTNHGSYIEIGFNCDNGDEIGYQIKLGCFDIVVSDICAGEDFEEIAEKLYKRLTALVEERLRENPFIVSARQIDFGTAEIVRPNVDVRQFATTWDGEVRDTGVTVQDAYQQFCDELEEV
jgi:hypothetical protein